VRLCTPNCKSCLILVCFAYTDLFCSADIEQEVNGLYTFNREEKLDPSKVKAVLDKAIGQYYNRVR
jgi:hypothetical protein